MYSAERFSPTLAANLLITCLRMGRIAGVRGGQADDEQTAHQQDGHWTVDALGAPHIWEGNVASQSYEEQ
jgi:hypothetical protein